MFSKSKVWKGVLALSLVTVWGLGMCYGAGPSGGDSLSVKMETFSTPERANYFALILKPKEATPPVTEPHDVVVLFNTSASQMGDFRAKALETLRSFLASLPAGDRVRLFAVDLNAIPLTEGFVAPNSPQMEAALAALEARVPLGATDMVKALEAVLESYQGAAQNARAAVYIGDGRSAARLLSKDDFQQLAERLVEARIPVSSFAVGLQLDEQLLGALAVQSGGTVIVDNDEFAGEEAGKRLAAATAATVFWPTAVNWPAEWKEVFPKRLPPLRVDRETIVIGMFEGGGPFSAGISAEGPKGVQKVEFQVTPAPSDDNYNYLAPLVAQARLDGGVTLPLVGEASLADARRAIGAGVKALTQLAREALAAGNLDGAEQMIAEALRRDPNDTTAQAVRSAIAKRREGGAAAPVAPPVVPAQPAVPGVPGDLNLVAPEPEEPPAGAVAEAFQHDRRVVTQMVQTELQNVLTQARSLMGTDPATAEQILKLMLDRVQHLPQLEPAVREQFIGQLQTALREAARRKREVEHTRQRQLETIAAAKEQELVAEELLRKQDRVRQLMERFNSLMDEGRYRLAEEASAVEAQKIAPHDPTAVLATLQARTVGYYQDAMVLRVARQKAVVDTLYQVERSHIPFPDEPPIVYPDAEVWQELTARRKDRYSSMDLAKRKPAEKRIDDALKSPTQLEFIDTPLTDVIDDLKGRHKIEIQLDKKALDELGIATDTPVTKNLKGISLRSALRLLLRDLGLTYVIQDEVLLITTPEEAENRLSTRVYPVADLVLPIPPPGSMGGMGMGGFGGMMGMGGFGGMGMMGMGGMGMGGMGMGGMGMGGMGMGGMWNLPRELLPKIPPGGFQAFSVKDAPENPDSQQSRAVPAAEKPNLGISLEFDKNVDPSSHWEQYFSRHQPKPAEIREAVRQLMSRQMFDHVAALIGAALRHRQGQPWMYEALALALDAAGRPKAELERAVMSAVEFAGSTADLLYVAAYLSQLGLHQRALQVYRQVAGLEPERPEPYMLGLRAARAIDDMEGLKWASVGILSQAWPKELAHVWQAGLGVSREVLERLRAEGRNAEADAFLAALDEAVRRDCIAIVTWTGEGDIDLAVEEPGGTVCSLRNPRTTAGGILIGDAIRQTGRDDYGGRSEVYVCPKGFDGTYRMLVRRVWGEVTAGKVNVEVATNFGSPDYQARRKRIPLEQDQALVIFELKDGRRKEPLQQRKVANVVGTQLAINRQILAQQLASAIDPRALMDLAGSRAGYGGSAGGSGGGGNSILPFPYPFMRGGAVGYQPVITVLPEGANLGAFAVVSADRRYVRITVQPMFSGISEVNTFNMATGENTLGRGGTGGMGYSGMFGGGWGGMGGMGGMGGYGGGIY